MQAQNKKTETKNFYSEIYAECPKSTDFIGNGKKCDKKKMLQLKREGGNKIELQSGSTLNLFESDAGCYMRLIKLLLNRPEITDADFRAAVAAMTK